MVQLEGHSGSEAVITSARVTRFVCWYEVDLGPIRAAVLTHCFFKEFQRGLLALFLRDEALEDFAFEFDSPPKAMAFAFDLPKHLSEISPSAAGFYPYDPALSDFSAEHTKGRACGLFTPGFRDRYPVKLTLPVQLLRQSLAEEQPDKALKTLVVNDLVHG